MPLPPNVRSLPFCWGLGPNLADQAPQEDSMRTQTTITNLSVFLATALLATACSESAGPAGSEPVGSPNKPFQWTPSFATVANGSSGIALDQQNGTLVIKGFNPTNPHRGDAIVATFFWVGSTNIIDSVVDVLTTAPTYTPVG